jgi:predicted nucleotidyltransferase
MNPTVVRKAPEVARLCLEYHVRRLDLFGSAAVQDEPQSRDLDFLVEFLPLPLGEYSNAFFGLLESLEQLFDRPIDLVIDSAIRNPYFRESVEGTRRPLYAA